MGPLDFLTAGGPAAAGLGQPLIKALLAKHGASLPEVPTVGPPKVGSDVGPANLNDAGERSANVLDGLNLNSPLPDAPQLPNGMADINASLTANAAKPRNGFLQRIGDFLHSDEGRAEAMRFAAGAFNGGIGGGLQAATTFADRRHHEAAETASADADRAEHGREFDENHDFHLGQLDLQREQNRETAEHNRRGDMNDSRRIDADLRKHDTPSGDELVRSKTSIYQHLNPSGDTVANLGEKRFEHITPSGDVATQQAGEDRRNVQDNQTAITTARIGHQPERDSIHVHYQATPDTLGAQHQAAVNAVRPSQVKPGDAGNPVHHVANDEQYNALPSGARFMGPDGQVRVKP